MIAETRQSDEQLEKRDISSLNLEAALGLPGSEGIGPRRLVRKLIRGRTWFERTPRTAALLPTLSGAVRELAGPFPHDGASHISAKAARRLLQSSLQRGRLRRADSRNLFVHGVLCGRGGTCVTMPVLYIAIGRRLGYPLHLVRTKDHFFARWEEPGGERFNIECTSPGFRAPDDDYYRWWPRLLSPHQLSSGCYLRNLRPREELAAFLCERTHCCMDNLRPARRCCRPAWRGNWRRKTAGRRPFGAWQRSWPEPWSRPARKRGRRITRASIWRGFTSRMGSCRLGGGRRPSFART